MAYGAAVALDAAGRRLDLTAQRTDAGLRFTVPASFLAGATWFVAVDPLITAIAIDTAPIDHYDVDVAFDCAPGLPVRLRGGDLRPPHRGTPTARGHERPRGAAANSTAAPLVSDVQYVTFLEHVDDALDQREPDALLRRMPPFELELALQIGDGPWLREEEALAPLVDEQLRMTLRGRPGVPCRLVVSLRTPPSVSLVDSTPLETCEFVPRVGSPMFALSFGQPKRAPRPRAPPRHRRGTHPRARDPIGPGGHSRSGHGGRSARSARHRWHRGSSGYRSG